MSAEGGAPPKFATLLIAVALAGILVPLNSTMLAVALPEIRSDFDIGHASVGWLVSSYLIAMVVAQPLGGRLGDQLGRAVVFRWALPAFLLFSLACVLAPNFALLVVFRTCQAITGASLIPNGMAMVREAVPTSHLGRANGLTGAALSLSAASGPLVGAALLTGGSWRLLFLVNIPLVALAILAMTRVEHAPVPKRQGRMAMDWPGILLFCALLAFVTYLLSSLREGGQAVMLGVAGVLAALSLAGFVWRQAVASAPVVEWGLFRRRTYSAATANILSTNLVMYTVFLAIPFFMREAQGRSSGETGLTLGAMSVLMAAAAPVSGRISDAYGRRLPAVGGSLLMIVGVVLALAGLSRDVSIAYLALTIAVMGLGVGLSTGAATTAAMESAPRELAGSAAGANSMMRYLGSILGAGILSGVLNAEGEVPGIDVFRAIFVVVLVMAGVALAASLLIHRFPTAPRAEVGLRVPGGEARQPAPR